MREIILPNDAVNETEHNNLIMGRQLLQLSVRLLLGPISPKTVIKGIKYSKTCLKLPLENRQNKGLKDKW